MWVITNEGRECTYCKEFHNWSEYCKGAASRGRTARCRKCRNEIQRGKKSRKINSFTYEKTKNGFLVRAYRNMLSRVTGVQRAKMHLYAGLSLLDKESFYKWSLLDRDFTLLFVSWELSGYNRKLTPSIDRIDSFYGYELFNMRWITNSENSRLGALNRHRGF